MDSQQCEKCCLDLFELEKIIADDRGISFLEVHSVIKCPTCSNCSKPCVKSKRKENYVWKCERNQENEDEIL